MLVAGADTSPELGNPGSPRRFVATEDRLPGNPAIRLATDRLSRREPFFGGRA